MRNLGRGLIYPTQRSNRWHYRVRNTDSVSPQKKGVNYEKIAWPFIGKNGRLQPRGISTPNSPIAPSSYITFSHRGGNGKVRPGNGFTGYSPTFTTSKDPHTVCGARLARRSVIFALGINGGKVGKPNYRPESQVDCSPRGG